MKMVLIFWAKNEGEFLGHIDGGIYNGITFEQAEKEIGAHNILYCIPLRISGFDYAEKREDLRHLAQVWQESNTEFIDWSYGELATIGEFFERNGKRYGLIREFRENGII